MTADVEWGLEQYVEVCRDFFRQRTYVVAPNAALHEEVRWRPHLLASKGKDVMAIEVRVAETFPSFWLDEIRKAKEKIARLIVYVAVPKGARIFPEVLVKAQSLGIGVYEIDGTVLNERIRPQAGPEGEISQELLHRSPIFLVSGETPYLNIRSLRQILRSCRRFLHWLDRHFDRSGLERLYDEIEAGNLRDVSEIRIACGLYENNITKSFHGDFKRFSEECTTRGVGAQVRVVCDRKLLAEIHDRFMITQGAVYNVLPVNAIEMGQFGEMFATTARPPFDKFWKVGLDLLAKWDDIQKALAEFQKKKSQTPPAQGLT